MEITTSNWSFGSQCSLATIQWGFFCKRDFTRSCCAKMPCRFSKVNQPCIFLQRLLVKVIPFLNSMHRNHPNNIPPLPKTNTNTHLLKTESGLLKPQQLLWKTRRRTSRLGTPAMSTPLRPRREDAQRSAARGWGRGRAAAPPAAATSWPGRGGRPAAATHHLPATAAVRTRRGAGVPSRRRKAVARR